MSERNVRINHRLIVIAAAVFGGGLSLVVHPGLQAQPAKGEDVQDLLYVGNPGSHDHLNGVGVLVFDVRHNYRFVKRIPTWDTAPGNQPEEVRGIAASAATGMLYLTTPKRIGAFSMLTDKLVWEETPEGNCCDRMAVSPDGKILYVPSAQGARRNWYVLDAMTGKHIKTIDVGSQAGAHNTLFSLDGSRVFMEGVFSRSVYVADAKTHTVVQKVGEFSNNVRPFTINGDATLIYATVDNFLGFEIGDVKTGKVIQHIPVAGYKWDKSQIHQHEMPNHGIALTSDEKEIWLADGVNDYIHVFDNTVMPPKQLKSIKTRSHPYWITFGLDGKYVYPSTGDVIEAATKKIVAVIKDELGRPVESEKVVEVLFSKGKPIRAVDQFGIGRKRTSD